MSIIYEIMSLAGDYPVEHQKYWANRYLDKEKAIRCAVEQHNELEPKYPGILYTIVKDVEEDFIVEWCIFKGVVYDVPRTATAKANEAEEIGKGVE